MKVVKQCLNLFFFFLSVFFLFNSHTAKALTVSPAEIDVSLSPGDETVVVLHVKNDSKKSITLLSDKSAFSIDSLRRPNFSATDEAVSWFQASSVQVTLHSGEETDLLFPVRIPKTAEPKIHQIALFATQTDLSDTNTVSVGTRVGTLLTLRVVGESIPKLSIDEIKTPKISFGKEIQIVVVVRNTGTITLPYKGDLFVRNSFGSVIKQITLNEKNVLLAPNVTAKETFLLRADSIASFGPLGIFSVIRYGESVNFVNKQILIWHLPPLALFLAVTLLVFVLVFALVAKKMLNKKKI